jgi:quercetin dioxygenase-like cupin family protein
MLIEGGMKLTVDGKTRTIRKGDEYLIPAHAKHSVTFLAKTRVMDLFLEKTRYKAKDGR